MKIALKQKEAPARRHLVPVIPLQRPESKELAKGECIAFKLRSTPTDPDSTTYELTIGYFGEGTPEELLVFYKNLMKVIVGQNVMNGPDKYLLTRRLLQGDALAAFDRAATSIGNETNPHFTETLQALIAHVFPNRALAMQKRYMRRVIRKPQGVTMRTFMARLNELNEYLTMFPPNQANQKLDDDEILDIAKFATPATWQKTMIMHGFDPVAHSANELVEFCERIEFTEADTSQKETKSQADSKSGKKGTKSYAKSTDGGIASKKDGELKNNKRKKSDKWCELHQTYGHDTGECKILLDQARKMRKTWAAGGAAMHKNKTWVRKDNEKTKEELHSIVNDAVKRALKDSSSGKKRKEEVHAIESQFGDVLNEFGDLDIEENSDDAVA